MYTRCIACAAPLGRNDTVEQFPVGRRLAFDPFRGRLWAICTSCRNWNLVPIEERWEAVEAGERLFETAQVGASTANVSLGRIREGLELIRIGPTDRREFAGWRYGDRIVARRRRLVRALHGSGGVGAGIAVLGIGGAVAGAAWGPFVIPAGLAACYAASFTGLIRAMKKPAMRAGDGRLVSSYQASRVAIVATDDAPGWRAAVPTRSGAPLTFEGDDALLLLRKALPLTNSWGGSADRVNAAVDDVERLGTGGDALAELARRVPGACTYRGKWRGQISTVPAALQLALEIVANEETERRARRRAAPARARVEGRRRDRRHRRRPAYAVAVVNSTGGIESWISHSFSFSSSRSSSGSAASASSATWRCASCGRGNGKPN